MRFPRQIVVAIVALGALAFSATAYAGHGAPPEEDLVDLTHLANSAPPNDQTNSDAAFWGNQAYLGNYDGFRIVDVADRSNPREQTFFPCDGTQNDVGVWDTGERRLLFLSVDGQRSDALCEDPGTTPGEKEPVAPIGGTTDDTAFEGIRIFDVTDPASPTYLRAVFTDCGSHTQTVIPVRQTGGSGDDREFVLDAENPDRVFIYVSSYPLIALGGADYRCVDTDGSPTHNKISIVEVPFDDPTKADVLKEVPLNPATLGFPTQESQGCHDIGVFIEIKLAAAACQGEGQIWDISDPANPDTMGAQRIENPNINYWHSGSFSWDGKYAIYGDEEGGAAATHGCFNTSDQQGVGTGATWFYDRNNVADGFSINTADGQFVQDRPQAEGTLVCTAHNYNAVPVSDRQLLVSAYYEGGSSMLDFTDIENIQEVAYFDAQGIDERKGGDDGPGEPPRARAAVETNSAADTWSTYWYNGNLFANDIARGLDIFAPTGKAAELTAGAGTFDYLNPQSQQCLVVAAGDDPDDCDPQPGPAGGGPGGPGPGNPGTQAGAQDEACTNRIDGSDENDKIEGSKSSDRIVGKGGNDRLAGDDGDDCLLGKGGKDKIAGNADNDDIRGGGAKDKIKGNGGDDEIKPGRGKDKIKAGGGDDVIHAARGARDRINCGRGEDVAIVNKRKDKVSRNCEAVTDRSRRDFATAANLQSH